MSLLPPLPVLPVEMTTITERKPVFRLNGRFGAKRYKIEVSRAPDFQRSDIIDSGFRVSDEGQIAPTVEVPWIGEPLEDGPWYWRAFCAGDDAVWTTPANYRVFHVSAHDADRIQTLADIDHPYLVLSREEIPELKEKSDLCDRYRSAWRYLLVSAEGALELTAPEEDYARSSRGQHGRYSTAATWYKANLEKIGFAYRMTGDARFAEKGREWLLAAAAYDCWLGPLFPDPKHFDPPWHAALETAMMTEGIAVGYDILFDILTESEREVIRNAVTEKGIKPLFHDWVDPVASSKLPRHQTATGNWAMVCACSCGVGALALLNEHPEARDWVRHVRDRVRWWLCDRGGDYFVDDPYPGPRPKPVIGPSEPNFGIDGGYKESIGYMGYAMRYICYFAAALHRVTGEDLFQHVPENIFAPLTWSIRAEESDRACSLLTVDFGDCGTQTALHAEILSAFVQYRDHGRSQWLLRRVAPVPFTPRAFIWDKDSVPEDPPGPDVPVKHFRTIGRVVMRTGWCPEDPLFLIKFHQNRGHHDLGTYWLCAGDPLVVDSGSADYGGKVYPRYLCHSHAHNVIWVGGKDQEFTNGKILSALGTPDWGSVAGDLTAAYPDALEKWTRYAVCVFPHLVIVADQLHGKGEREYVSLIHPGTEYSIDEPGNVHLGDGNEDVSLVTLSPAGRHIHIDSGYRKTSPADYLRIEPEKPAESATFLMAYLLGEPPDSGELAEKLPVEGGVGGRIDSGEGEVYVFLSEAGEIKFEEWSTDAQFLAIVFHPWSDRHGFLWHRGTFWTDDGVPLARTSAPMDLALQFFPSGIRGSINASGDVELDLQVEAPVLDVLIDGSPASFFQSPGAVSVFLPAGYHELTLQYRDRPDVREATRREWDDLPAARVDDPPLYRGARTRASSAWGDMLAPIDESPETAWTSLPGLPFPQWLDILLPEKEAVSELTIDLNVPAEFEILTAAENGEDGTEPVWETKWRGESPTNGSRIRIPIPPIQTDKIRLLFHRPLVESEAVGVRWIRWK